MSLPAFQLLEKKFEKQIRLFELKRGAIEKKIETHFRRFEEKNRIRLDDEVRFIRSWMEKPLSIGAVTPSSRVLARAMAAYVDPNTDGPVIELGPGTGPVTEALVTPSSLIIQLLISTSLVAGAGVLPLSIQFRQPSLERPLARHGLLPVDRFFTKTAWC